MNRLILFVCLLIIVVGCSSRGVEMKRCDLRDSNGKYIIRCSEDDLVLDRLSGEFRFIRGSQEVWRSTNTGDDEFSQICFKYSGRYVLPELGTLVAIDDNVFEMDLLHKEWGTIGKLQIKWEENIFYLKIVNLLEATERFGISLKLIDNVFHYGIGELTDENDIWRKLYHPTEQHFVLDNGSFERPYLQTDEGTDVISPLVLNSKGGFVFIDSYSYLDISFNRDKNRILKIHIVPEYQEKSIEYAFYMGNNTADAYNKWVNHRWRFRPDLPVNGRPSDELIKRPIWTTWALYKWNINQDKVIDFVESILKNDLPISYVEIDDRWTKKYGDLDFDRDRFQDVKGMIQRFHEYGIKVSLWVPPFVNQDADSFEDGVLNRAFVAANNSRYPALVGWWDSANIENAGLIDFFSDNGWNWFGKKIDFLINEYGIDGFKYDAGEAQFLPLKPRLKEGILPNMYSDYYARWGVEHRGVEMRSGYLAQNLPILFRQFDKASHWGFNNGLKAVMTQILSMGIVGYPFVLPDMIGGNEYLNRASEELFIRWVELNAFLPYMQFSIPPFRDDFTENVMVITKKYLSLREKIVPDIISAAIEAESTQLPVIRPLFLVFPEDDRTYSIEDEFMIKDRYLVAPVIYENARARDIYIPKGRYRNLENNEEIVEGPVWLRDYPLPLDVIPVFERIE